MTQFVTVAIERIAETRISSGQTAIGTIMPKQIGVTSAETIIEFAGRECYQSHHRPRPETAKTGDYITRTVHGERHDSILEHAQVTYRVTGVSRALLAELTRHRHLSFSVISQRFVNLDTANFVLPPALRDNEMPEELQAELTEYMAHTKRMYHQLNNHLTEAGLERKQAREAARCVMPNMTEVIMEVSGNLRAWKDVLGRRLDPHADAEIQALAALIYDDLHEYAPHVFPAR